jgi:hypothetical protein
MDGTEKWDTGGGNAGRGFFVKGGSFSTSELSNTNTFDKLYRRDPGQA